MKVRKEAYRRGRLGRDDSASDGRLPNTALNHWLCVEEDSNRFAFQTCYSPAEPSPDRENEKAHRRVESILTIIG